MFIGFRFIIIIIIVLLRLGYGVVSGPWLSWDTCHDYALV